MLTPERHGGDKLAHVAIGVPFLGVGIGPARRSLRIPVVEDALHHARVHQEAFNFVTFVSSPPVSGLAIDEELITANRHFGFAADGGQKGWQEGRGGGEVEDGTSGDHERSRCIDYSYYIYTLLSTWPE